jgi:SAM-dependent methyltransferase/UDP-N-acetylglucosamine transferase subunit ALG13
MASVVVTVGMGRWPFDRLVRAAGELADRHQVFVQTGTSTVDPGCEHAPTVSPEELRNRMLSAEIVVTHAGNTVRWLQRNGRIPIAVPRRKSLGEMGNDHQVTYLREEQARGRVIPVWEVGELGSIVDRFSTLSSEVAGRPVPELADPLRLRAQLSSLEVTDAAVGPFRDHPVRRYDFAWRRLAFRTGCHLDLGCNTGEFLAGLLSTTALRAVGVDSNDEVLASARSSGLPVVRTDRWGRLPFPDGIFDSVTALDVLEHVPDEACMLRELRRVARSGAVLVATVPAAHILSFLDPDNVKLRLPRIHATVYRARFGDERYRKRFVDLADGYRGDLAIERDDHTNFGSQRLLTLMSDSGFDPVERTGSNLLWRLWHPLSLLGGSRLGRAADRLTLVDGRAFSLANLFVVGVAR